MKNQSINQSIVNSSFGDIHGDIRIGIDTKDVENILRKLLIENRGEIENLLKQYNLVKIDIKDDDNITMQNIKNSPVSVNQLDINILHGIIELQQKLIAQEKSKENIKKLPHRPSLFIGRTAKLAEIHNKITATDLRNNIYLVNGIGGIGKTTIVQEYLYQSACLAHFQNIIHIPIYIDTINTLLPKSNIEEVFLYSMAIEININLKNYTSIEDRRQIILYNLKNLEGNTLLIIDNANDKDQLVEIRPFFREISTVANCKFLITTRTNPDEFDGAIIEIGELELSETVELFNHYYQQTISHQVLLKEMLKHINLHTLLTELLAKIGKKKGYFIEDLFDLLLKQDRLMKALSQQELQRKVVIGEHADTTQRMKLATLYQYIYSLFEPELLKEESKKEMVRFFSVLPSSDIPISHLKILWQVNNDKENDFENNLDFLQQWGWLTDKCYKNAQSQIQNLAYKMHPLVQEVVYEKLTPNINNVRKLVKAVKEIIAQPLNHSFEFQDYAKSIIDKLNLIHSMKK